MRKRDVRRSVAVLNDIPIILQRQQPQKFWFFTEAKNRF